MISLHEISSGAGAASYFANSFTKDGARQTDNYYVNEQAQATWQGKGAQLLGLSGEAVTREDFVALLDGKLLNPSTGEVQDLANNSKGADRRAGWDFSISAPKSVSIVGLVGSDERVIEAHRVANGVAMAWLEEHAAQIRVKDGNGQNVKVGTGNLVYATVSHETSRDNEPQLHNHNVIIAATYDTARDTWRSLTNDELFKLRADGDVVYKAELAKELKKAGYEVEYTKDGVNFEIKGLSAEQLETFSSRTKAIDAALVERGYDPQSASWAARQAAALDTRSKKTELPREVLHEVWQDTSRGAGLDVSRLVTQARERAQAPNHQSRLQEQEATVALRAVSWAVEHLSTREQSFKLPELEKTAVEFGQVSVAAVQEAVRTHTRNELLVVRDEVQDGMTVMTTMKGITAERQMIANISERIGTGKTVLTREEAFNAEVQSFEARKSKEMGVDYKLTGEQVAAARNMLMHPDAYQAVQGDAGTGKTAALEFVRGVAESRGWQVRGVAVSASAAQELQASSGIESQTLAKMFTDRETAAKQVRLEIGALQEEIAKTGLPSTLDRAGLVKGRQEQRAQEGSSRIEVQTLKAKSADINFGNHRYTFDHKRGDVFRSDGGLQGKMGELLVNLSERLQSGEAPKTGARSMAVKLKMQVSQSIAEGAAKIGESLMTYQKVGTVEAIAARNALYQVKADEREQLQTQLNKKQAELANLQTRGNMVGANTLLVMDESSMGGVHDMVKYTSMANSMGARVIIQGDEKQHGSVPAGRTFSQIKQSGTRVSTLEQTRRFDNATAQTKEALSLMKLGQFGAAMTKLDTREVADADLAATVGKRFIENYQELKAKGMANPKVAVVTVTNTDRKEINRAVQSELRAAGVIDTRSYKKEHLDDPKLTAAELRTVSKLAKAGVDRLIFRKDYQEIGVQRGDVLVVKGLDIQNNRIVVKNNLGKEVRVNPDWHDYFSGAKAETRNYSKGDRVEARAIVRSDGQEIKNGTRGTITEVDDKSTTIKWDAGNSIKVSNDQMRYVDLAYAHTSYKEQGATNDREIIALSKVGAKVFNRMAAYVATTRAKDNTEIVTSDMATLVRNADKLSIKTVASDGATAPTGDASPVKKESFEEAIGRIISEHREANGQREESKQTASKTKSDSKERTTTQEVKTEKGMEFGM